jgi:hypothetical protein
MGEEFFRYRPFKPLVERSSRSTLTFCLIASWLSVTAGGRLFRAAPRSLRSVQARSQTPTCGDFGLIMPYMHKRSKTRTVSVK